ncbi:MAG TPA: sensor histidine kinase [Phenylobacterium sp.]|nr:sensor histidine kinase [Phenylobacterium sp.]
MDDLIRRCIAGQPSRLAPQLAIATGCLGAATLIRLVLGIWVSTGIPYITYFPFLLLATLLGGLRAGMTNLLGATVAGSVFFVEGTQRWPLPFNVWTGMLAFVVSGGLIVWLSHLVTTSFRVVDDARQLERLLVLELQHRVKNTLSIVQSLASQTFSGRVEDATFRAAFTDRLVALGRAHSVLSEAAWREVTMPTLVARAIEPFVGEGSPRISVEGEEVLLRPALIVDLALCLHELATNAMKHGALSAAHGAVQIRWRRLAEGRVELVWQESGGPPVSPPTRRGFGSRLLQQGLSRGARPVVNTDYAPDGLRWTAQFDAG